MKQFGKLDLGFRLIITLSLELIERITTQVIIGLSTFRF